MKALCSQPSAGSRRTARRRLQSVCGLPSRLIGALVLVLGLTGILAGTSQAAGMAVSAFYTVSKAGAQPWYQSDATPRATATFPSRVAEVYYYIAYSGATPRVTHIQIKVYDAKGALIVDGYIHTLTYAAGSFMNSLTGMPDGVFHIALLVDGVPTAQTTFSVGRQLGAVITSFYIFGSAGFDSKGNRISGAPQTHFPRDTAGLNVYYRYTDATPGVTHFSLSFHSASGAFYGTADLGRASSAAGWAIPYERAKGGRPYPIGSYRVDLLVDGRVGASTGFTIDHGPATMITAFYPSTKAAYEAWIHTTSTAPPPKVTTFPLDVRQIACYFAYKGAKPGITTYKVVISGLDQPSAAVGPNTFRYSSGYVMVLVTATGKSGFPPSTSEATLYVDGQEVASGALEVWDS